MKKYAHVGLLTVVAAIFCLSLAGPARAASIILNGGFESGFSSWTRADQLGSDGTFSTQIGMLSPVNGDPVPAPPGGTFAAMTDAQGPGSHVLYQDFVAATGSWLLSFDLFIGNRADRFDLNQQARVDLLNSGADPFSVASGDILVNLYQTNVGDPLVSGYSTLTYDLTALMSANAGQTLRLRFAETDNVYIFQLGVDNITLDTTTAIPEPASLLLLGTGLAALLVCRRRS
jgi:hypothetical protein